MANKSHHPPHLILDDAWYMITANTHKNLPFLKMDKHKSLLHNLLINLCCEFSIDLKAWVIMDNHYHILMEIREGIKLKKFIQRLHGRSSFDLNNMDHARGRQVWHNYWAIGILWFAGRRIIGFVLIIFIRTR